MSNVAATAANIIIQHLMPRMRKLKRGMGSCPITPRDTACLASLQMLGAFTQREIGVMIAWQFGEITKAQMYQRLGLEVKA